MDILKNNLGDSKQTIDINIFAWWQKWEYKQNKSVYFRKQQQQQQQ